MKIVFVLGSGGHTTRALLLSKQLDYEKYYIVPWESEHTKRKVEKNYFSVISPRFKAKSNIVMTMIRTIFLFLHCLIILLIVRPKMIISVGSGISLPPFLVSGALGIKTVFIESPSRIYEPSVTGKMLLGKITLWLSSWKELEKKYKNIEYGGIIS